MAKKKTKKKTTTASKPQGVNPAHIVLGILVLISTFYVGYLFGQGSGMPEPDTKTGSEGVDTLTVIEYSDFECPFCSRAKPTVDQIKANYDNVEVVYKHFPLESIHPNAFDAAVASECVRNEGGDDAFWSYHDTLFENQGALDVPNLKRYATDLGIDISSCLDNQETAQKVRDDMAEGRARGVTGTPSFWVHDEIMVGALPYATLSAKIDEKLAGSAPAPTPTPAPTPAPTPETVDVSPGDYTLGDANAPVEIIEFSDFQCPFCQRAHQQTFPSLMENYIETGKASYSIRHFPLSIHQDAQIAGEAAECAGSLGGNDAFFTYVDTMFANQGALDAASLKGYAAAQGLDTSAFNECLDSGEFTQKVKDDFDLGAQLGVRGTPSFFINGKILVGAQPFSSFQNVIDGELS